MFLMKTPAIFVNVVVECWGRMLYYDNTDDAADWIGHLRVFMPFRAHSRACFTCTTVS